MMFAIRRARPADAAAILDVHPAAVRGSAAEAAYSPEVIDAWAPRVVPPERAERLARSIERNDDVVFVAEDAGGRIIGYGSLVPRNSDLRALMVCHAHARQGIGTALLEHLERCARDLGLTELRLNSSLNAQAFYEASGFTSLQRGEHVSSTGIRMACVHMRKSL